LALTKSHQNAELIHLAHSLNSWQNIDEIGSNCLATRRLVFKMWQYFLKYPTLVYLSSRRRPAAVVQSRRRLQSLAARYQNGSNRMTSTAWRTRFVKKKKERESR